MCVFRAEFTPQQPLSPLPAPRLIRICPWGVACAAVMKVHGWVFAFSSFLPCPFLSQFAGVQALIPVTIAQLLKAIKSGADGEMTIQGKELKQVVVRLVVRVVDMQDMTTSVAFTVEDGTGQTVVSQWVDSDDNSFLQERRASWRCSSPCRLLGAVLVSGALTFFCVVGAGVLAV